MTSLNRVAITGLGLVSPLGVSVRTSWQRLVAGESGIAGITHFDPADYTSKVAGEVTEFDPSAHFDAKELKRYDRFIQFGMVAAREALAAAALTELADTEKDKAGVILGSGIGGMPATEQAHQTLMNRGPSRISPFFIPSMLPNLLAGQVSIEQGWRGANLCPVTACATGTHAIGEAFRLIQRGELNIALAGGSEACVCPLAVAGFAAARALSTGFNDDPSVASRPFDAGRDGFVIGEGAGVLVLENYAYAKARGANILAVMNGFAQTADAHHMTLPHPDGASVKRAMSATMDEAGLTGAEISYVNAHATSTPAGDKVEAAAIAEVVRPDVVVSSTKGATGHLLGAAGAVEAVFSVQSIVEQHIPPTINLDNVDPEVVLTNLPTAATKTQVKHALSNSFGFGGTNAAVLFSHPEA